MPPWWGNDGNLTVLDDGTLHVRYPSNGIVEYWTRSDGRSQAILREARRSWGTERADEAEQGVGGEQAAEAAMAAEPGAATQAARHRAAHPPRPPRTARYL